MRARAEEVLKFVELDQKVFDLFALNPASEYEVFIKRFGNSGYMQVKVSNNNLNKGWNHDLTHWHHIR